MIGFLNSVDPSTAARWLGVLVPLIVGAITKKYTNPGLKAVTNVFVAAIVGSLSYLATAKGYDFSGFVSHSAEAFISGIVAYYGLLKPTGIAGKIADAKPDFGIGSPDLTAKEKGAEDAGDPAVEVVPVPAEGSVEVPDDVEEGAVYELDETVRHPEEDPLDHVGEPADAPLEIGRLP